jgi:hypothetical protein
VVPVNVIDGLTASPIDKTLLVALHPMLLQCCFLKFSGRMKGRKVGENISAKNRNVEVLLGLWEIAVRVGKMTDNHRITFKKSLHPNSGFVKTVAWYDS